MNVIKNIAELAPVAGLFLFISLITVNSILLKKKGVLVSAAGSNKSGNVKWIYPFFVACLVLFLTEITRPLHGVSLLPEVLTNFLLDCVLIRMTGVLSIFISVFILKTTLQHFGISLRFGLNENNSGKLVTAGIFAKSRNPFFLSLLLFFTGTALIFPNLFFSNFTFAAFIGIHFSILKEEKFMHRFYGAEYLEYQRKVRRYF